MQAGDLDRPYYFEIQKSNIINFNNNLTFGYTPASGVTVPIKAIGPGTATVTAYATDGSGLKASVKGRKSNGSKDSGRVYGFRDCREQRPYCHKVSPDQGRDAV